MTAHPLPRPRWLCLAALALASLALEGAAQGQQRLQAFLITGNGHGFSTYDSASGRTKLDAFYESPYRYPTNKADLKADGVRRRNLAWDFYFGINSSWLGSQTTPSDISYVDDTNIIHAKQTVGGTAVETYYWSPFGFEGNATIALLKAPGVQKAYALFNFHLGSPGSGDVPGSDGESLTYLAGPDALVETGPGGGAMIYLPLTPATHKACQNVFSSIGGDLADKTDCSGSDVVPGVQSSPAANSDWMGVAIAFSTDASQAASLAAAFRAWQSSRAPQKLLDDAQAEWTAWRKPIDPAVTLSSDETHLWRQSETVLRMAQVRVPNTSGRNGYGQILASLPNLTSWGDAQDWMDWSTAWVRDGCYAIVALAHSGHFDEARMGLEFMLNADPVGTPDYFANFDRSWNDLAGYRISVTKYFGNGKEWSDWGSPGNGRDTADYNVQLDGWGLFLWAAREYVSASGDTAWLTKASHGGLTVYDNLLQGVAQKLEKCVDTSRNIMISDASVWEDHNSYRAHFLFTTAADTRGLCDMALMASMNGDAANAKHFDDLHTTLLTGLSSFQRNDKKLASTIEDLSAAYYEDGSAAEVFNWGLMDPKSAVGTATLQMFEDALKVASGGYRRRTGLPGMYDNNEWILLDFRIADANRRAGNTSRADAILAPVVANAAKNFNLLPELYNAQASDGPIGAYTGSRPMVGYGSGAFIMSMLTRAGKNEPPTQCASSTCTEGTKRCNAKVPQTCDDKGAWIDGTACPFLCKDGGCAGECNPTTKQCSGLTPQQCDDAGKWQSGNACVFVCAGGDCTGSCVPKDKQCNGQIPEVCDSTGTWQGGTACAKVCNAGVCADSCTNGDKQCSRKIVQTCVNGAWQDGQSCPNLCSGGVCSGSCSPGDKQCNGTAWQQCGTTGEWQAGGNCQFACAGGVCGGSCVPETSRCDGATAQKCDDTGAWQDDPAGTCGSDADAGASDANSCSYGGHGPSLCAQAGSEIAGVWCALAPALFALYRARRRS